MLTEIFAVTELGRTQRRLDDGALAIGRTLAMAALEEVVRATDPVVDEPVELVLILELTCGREKN